MSVWAWRLFSLYFVLFFIKNPPNSLEYLPTSCYNNLNSI